MSTSHDPQFGNPGRPAAAAPATIVWDETATTTSPAWSGPGAFAEPAPEPAASAPSLSSAWASAGASAATEEHAEHHDQDGIVRQDAVSEAADRHDDPSSASTDQPLSPAWFEDQPSSPDAAEQESSAELAQPEAVEHPDADAQHEPDASTQQPEHHDLDASVATAVGADAAQPWVRPGTAPTADEVHREWTDRHGELPPSTDEPASTPSAAEGPGSADSEHADVAEHLDQPAATPHPFDNSGVEQPQSAEPNQWQQAQPAEPDPYAAPAAPVGDDQPGDPYRAGPVHSSQQPSDDSRHDPFAAAPHEEAAPVQGQAWWPAEPASTNEPSWGSADASANQDQPQQQRADYTQAPPAPGSAEAAWAQHHDGSAPGPMAADPAPGDAIPAPPGAETMTAPAEPQQSQDAPADDALTIGRSRDNSIVLDDMLVSRKHIRITADDQGLLLEDLGSRNGTYVNGRRVEQTHLQEGDRIGVGGTTFEVRDGWLVTI